MRLTAEVKRLTMGPDNWSDIRLLILEKEEKICIAFCEPWNNRSSGWLKHFRYPPDARKEKPVSGSRTEKSLQWGLAFADGSPCTALPYTCHPISAASRTLGPAE